MVQRKQPKPRVTLKDLEEVDLSLHEVLVLAGKKELSKVFGFNGSNKNIPIKRIKSQLTGTYIQDAEELRCNFNTGGIQERVGKEYNVYTEKRDLSTGLRYYLFIEPRGEKKWAISTNLGENVWKTSKS